MRQNFNLKRVRREVPNPKNTLRLHRGEFGHNHKKKLDEDRYYADTESLISVIKKSLKLKKNQNVVLGLGAEGLIKDVMLWHSLKNLKKNLLIYDPNYYMYEHFAKLFGYRIFKFKLSSIKTYLINEFKIINRLKKDKINLLVLVNPAAPLEKKINNTSLVNLLKYCKKKNIFIILDEVYADFYNISTAKLVNRYENLIIIKTFSKMAGYPGLKAGFSVSGKKVYKAMNASRLSVELSSYVVNKCIKILKSNLIKKNQKIISNSINWGNKNFQKINIQSHTRSIIWFTIDLKNKKNRDKVLKSLRNKKILVYKNFNKSLKNFISFTSSHLNNLKYTFSIIKKNNKKY
tara:strand:- start:563 stop:1603 length:1041 start_codon:yes stop_codon:yes gene_type:complete